MRKTARPKWARPSHLKSQYGIGRSQCYELHRRGEIEMVSLKPPGAKQGTALVNLDSVDAMIERRRTARS